jgi:hypothetical protein
VTGSWRIEPERNAASEICEGDVSAGGPPPREPTEIVNFRIEHLRDGPIPARQVFVPVDGDISHLAAERL